MRPRIVSDPNICGGEPCIKGTRNHSFPRRSLPVPSSTCIFEHVKVLLLIHLGSVTLDCAFDDLLFGCMQTASFFLAIGVSCSGHCKLNLMMRGTRK